MASIQFVLNRLAIAQLLKHDVVGTLEDMGQSVAIQAGPGHEVETFVGRSRARVTVRTATFGAAHSEAVNRSLTRAIDAARR